MQLHWGACQPRQAPLYFQPVTTNERPYHYREIIAFFLPLLLNQGVVALTAPFLNFGVSRALSPKTALAAFGASFSITIIFNSIILVSLKLYNSLLKDRESFFKILRFYLCIAAIAGLLFGTLALTGAGDWLFSTMFGLKGKAITYTKTWMLWMVPVPCLMAMRAALQGVSTVYRKTIYSAAGTGFRMVIAFGLVTLLITLFPDRPGMASGAAFCMATMAEIILLLILTRKDIRFERPTSVPDYDFSLNPSYIFSYSLPLWASSLAWTVSFSMINTFIGRTLTPEAGLAGFSILRSLNVCLNAPLIAVATTVLILGNRQTMRRLMALGMVMGGGLTLINVVLYVTPVGSAVLSGIFNLSGPALDFSQKALLFFPVTPLLFFIRFFAEGLFMREKHPATIGIAGIIRLSLLLASGFILVRTFPAVNGSILGMGLMTLAAFSDALFTAFVFYWKHRATTAR